MPKTLGAIEAVIEATGTMWNDLGGILVTRGTEPHLEGDSALSVESVLGFHDAQTFPTPGRLVLEKEIITYEALDLTAGKFLGIDNQTAAKTAVATTIAFTGSAGAVATLTTSSTGQFTAAQVGRKEIEILTASIASNIGRWLVTGFTDAQTVTVTRNDGGANPVDATGMAWRPYSGLLYAYNDQSPVYDFNLIRSTLEQARSQLFVDSAEGESLNVIGRNLNVTRPSGTNETDYRKLIKALAYNPRGTIFGIELVLTALFGPKSSGTWRIIEKFETDPAKVFIQLDLGNQLATTFLGKAFMALEQSSDPVPANSYKLQNILTNPNTANPNPILEAAIKTIYSIKYKHVKESLDMTALPSSQGWDYNGSIGVETDHVSIVADNVIGYGQALNLTKTFGDASAVQYIKRLGISAEDDVSIECVFGIDAGSSTITFNLGFIGGGISRGLQVLNNGNVNTASPDTTTAVSSVGANLPGFIPGQLNIGALKIVWRGLENKLEFYIKSITNNESEFRRVFPTTAADQYMHRTLVGTKSNLVILNQESMDLDALQGIYFGTTATTNTVGDFFVYDVSIEHKPVRNFWNYSNGLRLLNSGEGATIDFQAHEISQSTNPFFTRPITKFDVNSIGKVIRTHGCKTFPQNNGRWLITGRASGSPDGGRQITVEGIEQTELGETIAAGPEPNANDGFLVDGEFDLFGIENVGQKIHIISAPGQPVLDGKSFEILALLDTRETVPEPYRDIIADGVAANVVLADNSFSVPGKTFNSATHALGGDVDTIIRIKKSRHGYENNSSAGLRAGDYLVTGVVGDNAVLQNMTIPAGAVDSNTIEWEQIEPTNIDLNDYPYIRTNGVLLDLEGTVFAGVGLPITQDITWRIDPNFHDDLIEIDPLETKGDFSGAVGATVTFTPSPGKPFTAADVGTEFKIVGADTPGSVNIGRYTIDAYNAGMGSIDLTKTSAGNPIDEVGLHFARALELFPLEIRNEAGMFYFLENSANGIDETLLEVGLDSIDVKTDASLTRDYSQLNNALGVGNGPIVKFTTIPSAQLLKDSSVKNLLNSHYPFYLADPLVSLQDVVDLITAAGIKPVLQALEV